jgi:hypothetical protein
MSKEKYYAPLKASAPPTESRLDSAERRDLMAENGQKEKQKK